jgi:hypothetical protein
VFHIFWILGHQCFLIRHQITYFTPNSFAGKFSGCDLGFFHHVALLTWSNCGFHSQVEKGQWKRNTSCSRTRLIGQQIEVQTKNGQVYSCLFDAAKIESKNIGEVICITSYLSCI